MGRESRLRLVPRRDDDAEREQLQAFANQVEDEAHWQRLLATAATDENRVELERVIGPLLKFRQARCHAPSCESGELPIWQPVLIVRKRASDSPSWAPIEIRVCGSCKDKMTVRDVLSDDIWSQIVSKSVAAGEPVPARILSSLTFYRVM